MVIIPKQSGEEFLGVVAGQRLKPVFEMVALRTPLVPVFRPVRHQHEHARVADAVSQQVEQRLGLFIDPVHILEDHHDRLHATFGEDDLPDPLEGSLTLD